jgi:hypothetical protein
MTPSIVYTDRSRHKLLYSIHKGKRTMQKEQIIRRSSGAKAIAIDKRAMVARYALLEFLALLLSAAFALGLHVIFGR